MLATVLSFPVQHGCPLCKCAVDPDDLAECYACGEQFCRKCHECSCDRAARYFADLLTLSEG